MFLECGRELSIGSETPWKMSTAKTKKEVEGQDENGHWL
jgi:hypothetical protein